MNRKELIKLLDKYEIEYEITDNTKEVEEGLRLLDEALEKIGIIIPKETQVDTITTENDTEVPKYTTEWASSDDCISRQAVLDFPIRLDHYDKKNGNRHFVLGIESVMEYVELLPPVEPPKKVIAQIKVDTDELVERIKEEYEIKDLPVCEDAISRNWLLTYCKEKVDHYRKRIERIEEQGEAITYDPKEQLESFKTEVAIYESFAKEVMDAPPVEPKRPKTTETMMVDGEPTEIDPLSYEVGYTHGQFSELPKGEWKYGNGNGECPFCGRERQYGWDNFCGFCGADMRGDKE